MRFFTKYPKLWILGVGQAAHNSVYVRRGKFDRLVICIDFFDFYFVVCPAYGKVSARVGVVGANPSFVAGVGVFKCRPAHARVVGRLVETAVGF